MPQAEASRRQSGALWSAMPAQAMTSAPRRSFGQGARVHLYLAYLKTLWRLRQIFKIKAYGLGWTASRVGCEFDFTFRGAPFRFVPAAARSSCLLPAGIPNEPETHRFLDRVLEGKSNVLFIDVGASVGEFAIPMAHDPRVGRVLAFEPSPSTYAALGASAVAAPAGKLAVDDRAVGAGQGVGAMDLRARSPSAAALRPVGGHDVEPVEICALDDVVHPHPGQAVILLIDIEGGELEALRGARGMIRTARPLIIFEYNSTTRACFELQDARQVLGASYRLFRLRSSDGRLDDDLDHTWNVVAVPDGGPWREGRGDDLHLFAPCDRRTGLPHA